MRTFIRAVVFTLLLASVFVSSAKADSGAANCLYTYVGDRFTYATGIYAPGDRVTGSFDLSGSFVPDLTGVGIKNISGFVTSYDFTDGHQTLTQANSTAIFHVGFNLDGTPVVPTDGGGINNGWEVVITTSTGGITTGDTGGDYVTDAFLSGSYAQIVSSNQNLWPGGPGTWTVQRVPVPEGGSTALFLFIGLGGLTILTRFSGLKTLTRKL
jgi:hypothetical protein